MNSISMDVKANYVTRQSMWSNHLLGTLTDRKIAHYQEEGYYSNSGIIRKIEKKQKKVRSSLNKKKTKQLFAMFNL